MQQGLSARLILTRKINPKNEWNKKHYKNISYTKTFTKKTIQKEHYKKNITNKTLQIKQTGIKNVQS
jgi:hypothetical protein